MTSALAQDREQTVQIVEAPAPFLVTVLHAEQQVLLHRERRKDVAVLGHVAQPFARYRVGFQSRERLTSERDRAGHRHLPHDRLDRGRAPGAVASKQRHDLASPDVHVHAVQNVALAVVGVKVVYFEHGSKSISHGDT
jgi:hypothetical protein